VALHPATSKRVEACWMSDASAACANAQALPGQPMPLFLALSSAMQASIGHRLFTIMRHDARAGFNTRLYSSDLAAYPAGGRKPVGRAPGPPACCARACPSSAGTPPPSASISPITRPSWRWAAKAS